VESGEDGEMKRESISQTYLKECLDYNPSTGSFTWKERPAHHFKPGKYAAAWNRMHAGKMAGCINNKGYRYIGINCVCYKAHRLAWLYVHGAFPKEGIDHINGNYGDNRLSNLREADVAENGKNRKRSCTNSSGVTGVVLKPKGKYQADICVNGKRLHLGTFPTFEEAVRVRKEAEVKYGFHENHDRASNRGLAHGYRQ